MKHTFKYMFRNFNKPLGTILALSIAACILGYVGIYLFEGKGSNDDKYEYYLYIELIQKEAVRRNSVYDKDGWELVYLKDKEVTDIKNVRTFEECFNYLKGVEKKYFLLGFDVYCYSEKHNIVYDISSDWLNKLKYKSSGSDIKK